MSLVTKSDFDNWKLDSVTKAFFEACQNRIDEAKEILSYSAGTDSLADKHLIGLIQAYREIHEFRIDDLQETDE